ncbi:MAG: DegT/DnrJ/EryC1/StrS family aminotransferase, partial [Desulfomonile sp.]
FFATVGSVLRLGARVVFADIEPESFNIDPYQVEKAITPKTRAIIPVHLFGQSAEMGPLLEISAKYGLPLIEDAAQAIGAEYMGKRAGSFGLVGCFSFFPSKNLGAFGDAGMITTSDKSLADRIRIIRNHGSNPKYHHKLLGGNFRLDAIQAAVLRVKLKHLEEWTKMRRENAAYYTQRLHELGLTGEKIIPPPVVRERHVYNQYVVRAKNRDALREFLGSRGVGTEIYYPKAIHLQDCVIEGRYKQGDFPISEKASDEVLALPIYPELNSEDKEYVVSMIKEFYER